jgi:hypothetical protein
MALNLSQTMLFPNLKECVLISINYDKKADLIELVSDIESMPNNHRSFVLFEFEDIEKLSVTKGISQRPFDIYSYLSSDYSFTIVFQSFNIVQFEQTYFVQIDWGLSYGKLEFYAKKITHKKRVLYAKKNKNNFQYFDTITHSEVDFYHPFDDYWSTP